MFNQNNEVINGKAIEEQARKEKARKETARKSAERKATTTYTNQKLMAKIIENLPVYQYQAATLIGVNEAEISFLKNYSRKSLPRDILLALYELGADMRTSWADYCLANGTPEWGLDFPAERDKEAWRIENAISSHVLSCEKGISRSFVTKFQGNKVPYGVKSPDVAYTVKRDNGNATRVNIRILPFSLKTTTVSQRRNLVMEASSEVQNLLLVDAKDSAFLGNEGYVFALSDEDVYKILVDKFRDISTNTYISIALVDTNEGVVVQETPLLCNGKEVAGILTNKKRMW